MQPVTVSGWLVFFEQQPDAGAIEECQIAEAVELSQPEHFFKNRFRPIHVEDRQRDLADLADIEQHGVTSIVDFVAYLGRIRIKAWRRHSATSLLS
jgi:hypothetical protein